MTGSSRHCDLFFVIAGSIPLLSGIIIENFLEVLLQKVLNASVCIGDLIFQQTRKREEIVVPGSIRYPLGGGSRIFSKHCSMGKDCS